MVQHVAELYLSNDDAMLFAHCCSVSRRGHSHDILARLYLIVRMVCWQREAVASRFIVDGARLIAPRLTMKPWSCGL